MKKRVLFFVLICLFAVAVFAILSGCRQTVAPPQNNSGSNTSANAKRYPFKGKVVSVNKEKQEATISHEAVPEISMDAMTMPFPIKDTWVMDELSPGSQIFADLVVDKGEYYLQNVKIIALPNPDQPPPPIDKAGGTVEGAEVPDLKLTNQDGKRISLKDFRGKALAVTFIYTRCPLPNYCPLMMLHFSEMAMNIQQSPELKDKVRLLSISFDPKNDTPPVLKKFASGYYNKDVKPDFTVWQLATGSEDDVKKAATFFGLYYQSDPADKKVIDHSLRTFVIDPQGKVKKVFPGNDWTTDQVLRELQNSLAAP